MNSIGRYQLVEKLGQGGMGIVYRAFDTLLQRVVALKVISGNLESGAEQRERFFREARAAGQLSHRNIITIYDLGEHEGQPYLAMEYLAGEDLQRRLEGPSRMSLAHKVDLAMQVCEGLEYAHAHGVIHRDIKPANIFLTDNGTAKILDFGLARLVTSELTNSNMMMGTVNYMAPEQVRGERADHRSDIFSAGVVFYEILGGRKAFEGESFAATLFKILQDEPEPLARLDPTIPRDLAAIVERALAKPRDERYQHIADMLRDLAVYRQQLAAHDAFGERPLSDGHGQLADPASTYPLSGGVPGSDRPTVANVATPFPPVPAGSNVGGQARRTPSSSPRAKEASAAQWLSALGPRAWVTAAFAMLAVVSLAVWAGRKPQPTAPAPVTPTHAAIDHAAAVRAFSLATQALDAGNFTEAQRQADAALALDPDYGEARRVRDRAAATADNVDRGLREARAHYEAGRFEEAARAAGNVISVAPGQPEAQKLMRDAAAQSRGRGAEEARARMTQAKVAARAAGAARLAPGAYNAAVSAERAAQRLYDDGQLGAATSKFYEASGLFGSAEFSAQSEAAARAQAAPQAPRPETERPSTQGPERGAPAPLPTPSPQSAPATPEPPPTASAAKAPDVEPRGTPVIIAPPKAPAVPTPSEQPAESAISDVIGRYRNALQARDLDALKRLWPGLGGGQESALRNEFQHANRITVEVASPHISVAGATATATFVRRYELVTTDGQRLASASLATMSFRQTAAGWVIDRVRFEPVR